MHRSSSDYPSARDLMDALRFLPEKGQIWLGEQRMLLMSISAFSFFRDELIKTLGIKRAQGLFMRLGYYSGTMDAELGESLRGQRLGLEEKFLAGPQLHALKGQVEAVPVRLEIDLANDLFYSEFVWKGSFEVDSTGLQGHQNEATCWTLLGYATGYATQLFGREVQYREVTCKACGDNECRIVGRLAEEWSDHQAHAEMLREAPLIDELYELQERVATLESDLANTRDQEEWGPISAAPSFRNMLSMLDSAAPSGVPVLLLGETGTGKEILARRLHDLSTRSQGPFVAMNCAAMPPELIESELFGVEKGAYTGAERSRMGRFERANGGTLFLDELSELSSRAQAALLRTLQEHQIERVGGEQVRNVDVRIIAATHTDLPERVVRGEFREDLYYRLNTMTVNVPPLSQRLDDIMPLAKHFLRQAEQHYQRRTLGFSDQASSTMQQYRWPGNVRELKNAVERGVILTPDSKHITERALFGEYRVPTIEREEAQGLDEAGMLTGNGDKAAAQQTAEQRIQPLLDADMTLEEVEQKLIEAAHAEAGGNITAAARRLGMTRAAYAYRMKKYGLHL